MTWDEALSECTARVHNAVLHSIGGDYDNYKLITHARRIGLGFGAWTRLIGKDGELCAGIGLEEARPLNDADLAAEVFKRLMAGGLHSHGWGAN